MGNDQEQPKPIENAVIEKTREIAVVIEKPLSLKHKLFCDYIVRECLPPLDAYLKVYPRCKRNHASPRLSALLKDSKILNEIERLRKTISQDKMESISFLHDKAVNTLDSLMVNSDKDSVRLGALREVLSRTVPVINRSQSVKVVVKRTELDRINKALSE